MDTQLQQLTALGILIVGVAAVYGRTFGPTQQYIVQAVIDAAKLPSRYRPAANIIAGEAIALVFAVIAAVFLHDWRSLGVSILAGLIASSQAAQVHDAAKADETAAQAS